MKDVYIIGAYTTNFVKWPGKTFKQLAKEVF